MAGTNQTVAPKLEITEDRLCDSDKNKGNPSKGTSNGGMHTIVGLSPNDNNKKQDHKGNPSKGTTSNCGMHTIVGPSPNNNEQDHKGKGVVSAAPISSMPAARDNTTFCMRREGKGEKRQMKWELGQPSMRSPTVAPGRVSPPPGFSCHYEPTSLIPKEMLQIEMTTELSDPSLRLPFRISAQNDAKEMSSSESTNREKESKVTRIVSKALVSKKKKKEVRKRHQKALRQTPRSKKQKTVPSATMKCLTQEPLKLDQQITTQEPSRIIDHPLLTNTSAYNGSPPASCSVSRMKTMAAQFANKGPEEHVISAACNVAEASKHSLLYAASNVQPTDRTSSSLSPSAETIISKFIDFAMYLRDTFVHPLIHAPRFRFDPIEINEVERRLSFILSMDFQTTVLPRILSDFVNLPANLKRDPSLSDILQQKMLKLIDAVNEIISLVRQYAEKVHKFFVYYEECQRQANLLRDTYDEFQEEVAKMEAEVNASGVAIQELDLQISHLQKHRSELVSLVETKKTTLSKLISTQKDIGDALELIKKDIGQANKEKQVWEARKRIIANLKVDQLSKHWFFKDLNL